MILTTGDLESVPILLTRALANDGEEWWIEVHLHDESMYEGYLRDATLSEVSIQDESGDLPFGVTVQWHEVAKVVIP